MGNPQGPQFPSVYNLTFDEVQSQLGNIGKPLNTMNLDELMKSLIFSEDDQNPSSSSLDSLFLGNFNLSKKTVDEVWKEIVNRGNSNAIENQSVTLGETTLEDFLVRAGVMNMGNQAQPIMAIDPMADWLQFQMQQQQMTVMDSNFNVSESVFENPVLGVGYSDNQMDMSMPMSSTMSATSSSYSETATVRKRRYTGDMMEKTIERRQKRMIKNRESAARSRAKKQAYTNRLEHEVIQLRKTNGWLKKQKEVEALLSNHPNPTPKYQLRRTSSSPF